jgi:hypothetical protein
MSILLSVPALLQRQGFELCLESESQGKLHKINGEQQEHGGMEVKHTLSFKALSTCTAAVTSSFAALASFMLLTTPPCFSISNFKDSISAALAGT